MKVYSEKDHRGNELLKNSGKGVDFDSAFNRIQWGDLEDWTPTDGSGASLSLTINSAKKTKVGKFVLVQFDITYPVTASTANAKISGMPDSCDSAIYLSLISIASISLKLRPFLNGTNIEIKDTVDVAKQNVALSGGRILLTVIYLTGTL